MSKNSKIEYTHHTFNPWWGCVLVSLACLYCYAERWAKRCGFCVWGNEAPRRFFGDRHWHEPIAWNKQAERVRERRRVFCGSMCDVFEDRPDLIPHRERLWNLIRQTPWLYWLLLTKRPENIKRMSPNDLPENVWLGTTVETQSLAAPRLKALLRVPASLHFVSCEPLLQSLNLAPWLDQLGWVIVGGESGPNARPMRPEWARNLRDQCATTGVPFFFKQWGEWAPATGEPNKKDIVFYIDGKSSVAPQASNQPAGAAVMRRVGKKKAGRTIDGRTWDELPRINACQEIEL